MKLHKKSRIGHHHRCTPSREDLQKNNNLLAIAHVLYVYDFMSLDPRRVARGKIHQLPNARNHRLHRRRNPGRWHNFQQSDLLLGVGVSRPLLADPL